MKGLASRSNQSRRVVLGVLIAAATALALTATTVAASAVIIDRGTGSNGPNSVTAVCKGLGGVTTDPSLRTITYAIEGQADAVSTKPGVVGVGTSVTCIVKNASTGSELGRVGGGLPGPHAEAVGTVVIPIGSIPVMCAQASAAFSDGTGASRTC